MKDTNAIFESYFFFFRLETTVLGIMPEFGAFDCDGSPMRITNSCNPDTICNHLPNFSISVLIFISDSSGLTVIGIFGISSFIILPTFIGETTFLSPIRIFC